MNNYYCSKCKLAVVVVPNEKPIKACKCEAPVVADMTATVVKNGGGIKS